MNGIAGITLAIALAQTPESPTDPYIAVVFRSCLEVTPCTMTLKRSEAERSLARTNDPSFRAALELTLGTRALAPNELEEVEMGYSEFHRKRWFRAPTQGQPGRLIRK